MKIAIHIINTLVFAGLMAVSTSACVIHMKPPGPPSKLKGVQAIAVEFIYDGMLVSGLGAQRTEEDWVKAKTAEDPEYTKTWADLKSTWEKYYLAGLSGGSPVPVERAANESAKPGTAVLKVTLSELTMGKYMFAAKTDSRVVASNTWLVDGVVVESNTNNASYEPSMTRGSIFQHVPIMAKACGQETASFLQSKQY